MEIIGNQVATIYQRQDLSVAQSSPFHDFNKKSQLEDRGQEVAWLVKDKIRAFPKFLAHATSVPYLFSPNFKFQIDLDYRAK